MVCGDRKRCALVSSAPLPTASPSRAYINSRPGASFTTIAGGVALQAGFLVAFKQLVPEHTVTLFRGLVKLRVKHFPFIFLVLNTASGPLLGTSAAAILAWLGFLASWTYLRFYKRAHPDLGSAQAPSLRGDASEIFELAYFFPDLIQPPIRATANAELPLKHHALQR